MANLNSEFKVDEVVHAINTFKDYRAPGEDMIINRDLTILLHPAEDNTYRWDIVNFIHKILIQFWASEMVPENLKESIILPFLKPGKNSQKREN